MSTAPDYALLDQLGLGQVFFYPRADRTAAPEGAEDVPATMDDGVEVGGRFYPLDPAAPTVLLFHGNGEVAPDYDGFAPFYHLAGLNLFVADYRGYGASGGSPSFATLMSDAYQVLAHVHALLDERGFGGPRLVMGRSLGALPAAELAAGAPERLAGWIVESGGWLLDGLGQRFGAASDEIDALAAGHAARMAAITLPLVQIHGDQDEVIPLERATAFHGALTLAEPGRELVVIAGAGHNDIFHVAGPRYFEAILGLVARTTGGRE